MSIKECAWPLPSGTLKAFYHYNEEKEKYKLTRCASFLTENYICKINIQPTVRIAKAFVPFSS